MGNNTSLNISPTSSFSSTQSSAPSPTFKSKLILRPRSKPKRQSRRQPVSYPQPIIAPITDDRKLKILHPKNLDDVRDMQVHHYVYQLLWQSHFSAPVEEKLTSGARVLDVGCNTGTWISEIAPTYPLTTFIGIDVNPLFSIDPKPHNVRFVQANVLDKLPFDDNTFDYIRMALFTITLLQDEWLRALQELVRVLKPGGFIELMEPDYRLQNMGPNCSRIISKMLEFYSLRNLNGEIARKLELVLAATNNITDIQHMVRTLIIGQAGGKTGVLFEDMFHIHFNEEFGEELAEFMEISWEEYTEIMENVKREFAMFKTFCTVYRFWAVKSR